MPGHDTTNTEYRDRISKTKEILMKHDFAMSAVPEICSTFRVSKRTAHRYKHEAEVEIKADIDLTDEEAAQLFLEGVLEVYHTPGTKSIVKLRALDMLAKAKGVYRAKKIELTSPLQNLSDDELQAVEQQLGLGSAPADPNQSSVPATEVPDDPG